MNFSVLAAVAVPPPVSGQSAASAMLLERLERDGVAHGVVDLTRPLDRVTGPLWLTRRALESVRMPRAAWSVARTLPAPVVFYLQLAQSVRGMLRDLPLLELAAWRRWPTVVHVHGGGFRSAFDAAPAAVRAAVARALRRVARAVVLTPGLRTLFDGLVAPERIAVVSNGVDDALVEHARTHRASGAAGARHGTDGLRVLYLSNLMHTKGYTTVLEAARLSHERGLPHRFVFCGARTHETTIDPDAFIQQHGLADSVEYRGPVHGQDKLDAFAEADVFVLPTAYPIEGQPISILEAMHYGLPVVTTAQGGIPDIFAAPDQAQLLIEAGDAAALLARLELLRSDAATRERIATANLGQARQHYTSDAHGSALLALFDDVAREHAPGRVPDHLHPRHTTD